MTGNLLALLAANALFLLAGLALLRAIGFWRAWRDAGRVPGLAYMAGVATTGVAATVGLVAGLELRPWQVVAFVAVLAAIGLARPGSGQLTRALPRSTASSWLARGITLVLAGYLAVLFVRSLVRPLNEWDDWAMWTMKARAIVLLDGLDPAVFAGRAYSELNLQYPLFLPALEAVDFHFMGDIDGQVIHVQFWLLLAGFLLATFELLRDRVPLVLLSPLLLLLAAAPALGDQSVVALADAPLAFFVALAAVSGWRYVEQGDSRFAALLAVFGAAAVTMKLEGLAFIGALVLVLIVFARGGARPVRPLLAGGGIAVAALVPWWAWSALHDVPEPTPKVAAANLLEPRYVVTHADDAGRAASALASESLDPGRWLVVMPLGIAILIVASGTPAARRAAAFAGALVGLFYVSLVLAYWAAEAPPGEGIDWWITTSAHRVVTSAVVTTGVLAPVVAASGSSIAGLRSFPPGE